MKLQLGKLLKRLPEGALAFDVSVIFGGFSLQLLTQIGWLLLAVRYLGPEGYGVFAGLTGLTFTVGCFVGWGSGPLLVRGVSAQPDLLQHWMGHALICITVTGIAAAAALMLLLPWLEFGTLGLVPLAAVVVSDVVFGRYASLCVNIYMARGWASRQSSISVIVGACKLVAMALACIRYDKVTLSVWAWWYLGANVWSAAICLRVATRDYGWPRWRWIPGTLRLGFAFSAENAMQSAIKDLDKLIVLQILGPTAAGYYATAFRIIDTLIMPLYALAYATYSRMFRLAADSTHACVAYGLKLLPISVAIGGAVGIGALVGAGVLPLVFGSAYGEVSWMVRLLAPMPALMGAFMIGADILSAIGRQEIRLGIVSVSLVISLVLCRWVVGFAGLEGAFLIRLGVAATTTLAIWAMIRECGQAQRRHTADGIS